jgi:hypothetical protein
LAEPWTTQQGDKLLREVGVDWLSRLLELLVFAGRGIAESLGLEEQIMAGATGHQAHVVLTRV